MIQYVQEQLDEPLLVSSVPAGEESGCQLDETAAWWNQVDFIVERGQDRGGGHSKSDGSTIYDLTGVEPLLVREGLGAVDLAY